MKIACLGWGSLIWRPETLLIRREWFLDGPILPVEFVRQSRDGRLTLVLSKNAEPVRVLWSLMATNDLDKAILSLGVREGIAIRNSSASIGSVTSAEATEDKIKLQIQTWAKCLNLDAVIWTNLHAKFKGVDSAEPTIDEAVKYLSTLDVNARATAEEYVRRAPKQIDTDFRREFERLFGWTYIG
jgi:hypothetical protein